MNENKHELGGMTAEQMEKVFQFQVRLIKFKGTI